jgi:hypothetical protein
MGQDLNPQTDALAQSLEQWATNGNKAGEATRLLGDDFEHLSFDLGTLDSGFWAGLGNGIAGTVESFTGLGDVADESLTHAKERITALDGALSQMVSAGHADQANAVFEKLAEEAKETGVNVDELKKGLPQYSAAIQTAGKESATTSGAIDDVGTTAEQTADQVKQLSEEFEDLFDKQMSADRAAIKLEESVISLEKEMRTGARTLALNSEEGRKNRTAVLDQLEAIDDLRKARLDEGEALDVTNRKYAKDVEALRKSMIQAGFNEKQVDELIGAYRRIPGQVATSIQTPGLNGAREGIKGYDKQLDALARKVKTEVSVEGKDKAYKALTDLLVMQQAAKKGISVSAARSAFNKNAGFRDGGRTAMVGEGEPAGVVHGQEMVLNAPTVRNIDRQAPGFLDEMHATGRLPGYAGGGRVISVPFPVNASQTKIPDWSAPPSGGQTSDWIVAAARALVPGIRVLSKDRPGARTLSGNVSYHARGRAVDFEPSEELAREWNERYKAATKELISPYQQYNLHNGSRHRYTGAIWNQHNFAGGNAHDHIAMRNGGTITEPIHGVGASGRTYSFGENWQPERVMPTTGVAAAGGGGNTINLTVNAAVGSHPRDIGRQVVEVIGEYLGGGGELRIRGTKVF